MTQTLPLFLEETHYIPAYEADVKGLWRPYSVFLAMQELAGAHSVALGCGREALLPKGMVWMLARSQLKLTEYPKEYDTVTIKTWPGVEGRATFPRYFTFQGANGQALGAGATAWMLVDIEKRRIVPPAKAALTFPNTSTLLPPLPEPQRFRLTMEEPSLEVHRRPEYGDIDINGHMNNASYIGWITDLFPLERHKAGRIRELAISYAAEAVPGEWVRMRLYEAGNEFEVLGLDDADGHTVFEARGQWKENN